MSKRLLFYLLMLPTVAYGAVNRFDLLKGNRLDVDNIRIDGNTVSTTNTNGNILLVPNGTGVTDITRPSFSGSVGLGVSASRALATDSFGNLAASVTTAAELAQSSGVTSALCGISQSCTLTNKTLSSPNLTGSINIGTTTAGIVTGSAGGVIGIATTIPIANGGTSNGSLSASLGTVYYGDGTKIVGLAPGTSGYVLQTNGAGGAPTWVAQTGGSGSITAPPSMVEYTSGSGTYNSHYTFVVSSCTMSAGATYTHNAVTYTTVIGASSSNRVVLSGSSAPLSSGILTKSSGTGDSSCAFSSVLTALYLRIRMVGGGGGGGGSGTAAGPSNASSGGNSSFGSSFLTANGGAGGDINFNTGGAGGGASYSSPAVGISVSGGSGGGGGAATTGISSYGGVGGSSAFGGAGYGTGGTAGAVAGGAAATGSGSGGGGASKSGAGGFSGSGGGAGGYVDVIVYTPSATYSYSVGAGGAGGNAGPGGAAGGSGAAGKILVEAHYQ